MAHEIDAQRGAVGQFLIQVRGDAAVTIRAQSAGYRVERAQPRLLAGQVDAAPHSRYARFDRPRSLEDLGLLQVEDVGAAGQARVSDAVHRNALLRRKPADREHVAPAQIAFARTERDARHVAQHVLQALGLLFLQHRARDDRDALWRIEQRLGEFPGLDAVGLEGRGIGLNGDRRQEDSAVCGRRLAMGLGGGGGAKRHAQGFQGQCALRVCFL